MVPPGGALWSSTLAPLTPGTETAYYEAPVSLPQGATITKLVVYYYDGSADDLTSRLWIVPLYQPYPQVLASLKSSSDGGYGLEEDTSINYPVIDQQSYSYAIEVVLPPDSALRLTGFRIDYGYASKLPPVMRNR